MSNWRSTLAAALAVALIFTTAALGAQGSTADKADEQELLHYRLTLEALHKVDVASQTFAKNLQNDPIMQRLQAAMNETDALEKKSSRSDADNRRLEQLQAEINASPYRKSSSGGDSSSLSDIAAQLTGIPPLALALKTAGITAREFATFEVAMFQASLYYGMKKAGTMRTLPPEASVDNVQFIADHEAEVRRVGEELQSLGK
jgi:hypothetical protein